MRLSEAVSAIVYHYTTIPNARKIMQDGKINLTPTIRNDTENDIGAHKFYFLSLTRSRHGAYHRESPTGVLFKLDGRKLSANFKSKAVDYWDTFKDPNGISLKNEMEDRLFTDQPIIDITKYLMEISILVHDSPATNQHVLPLYTKARKLGIPVYIYRDNKAWVLNDKRKALSLEEIKAIDTEKTKPYTPRTTSRSGVREVVELFYKNRKADLSKDARKRLETFRSFDYKKSLAADLHNETGSITKGSSANVRKLIDAMKKGGFRDFGSFMEHLKNKWDRISKEEEKKELMDRFGKAFDAIEHALDNEERVDLSLFSGETDKDKAYMVRNMIYRMVNYNIKTDVFKRHYPDFDESGYIGNIVDSITLRLTGQML